MTSSLRRFSRVWNGLALSSKGLVVVFIPLSALLVAATFFFVMVKQDSQAESAVRHTFEVRSAIRDVFTLLLSAETSVQGYLLVGVEDFLTPYLETQEALAEALERLDALLQNDPAQRERLGHVVMLTERELESLASLQEDPANLPPESQLALLQESNSLMSELRQVLGDMRSEEEQLLALRSAQARDMQRLTEIGIIFSVIYGIGGGLLATLLFTSGVVRRVQTLDRNALLLTKDRPLLQPAPGEDEIGRLGERLRQTRDLLSTRNQALQESQIEVLERLAQAAEHRDDGTGRHTQRVGEISALIARALKLAAEEVQLIRLAAPLHDVGKIGIPDYILRKPHKLTLDEFEAMKRHTEIGKAMLTNGRSRLMHVAEEIAYSHHERWDGRGYPGGLKGEAIPLAGRIVAVADMFDALISERPYKSAWSLEETLAALAKEKAQRFDPRVVEALLSVDWRPWLAAQQGEHRVAMVADTDVMDTAEASRN